LFGMIHGLSARFAESKGRKGDALLPGLVAASVAGGGAADASTGRDAT